MTHCQYCHQPIDEGVHPYTLRLELFPAVEPSLEIAAEDHEVDYEAELARLIHIMEEMDEAQVARQENLVYVSHAFTLCPACRDKLARQLSRLAPPPTG